MKDNMILSSDDVLRKLHPNELQPRLELQSTAQCTGIVLWAECGCGIVGCCPYVIGGICTGPFYPN